MFEASALATCADVIYLKLRISDTLVQMIERIYSLGSRCIREICQGLVVKMDMICLGAVTKKVSKGSSRLTGSQEDAGISMRPLTISFGEAIPRLGVVVLEGIFDIYWTLPQGSRKL